MTASRRLRFRLALLLALVGCAAAASAEPAEAEKAEARALMAEGRARREKRDFEGALASFGKADAIMHVPTTSFEVARTQVELGRL
ncbi:MAG TPA: hypothetical protein VM686_40210, partial [Polyangiaceae bacterium]|nr:hypothetical protein [Polyangiaceae bacterium]